MTQVLPFKAPGRENAAPRAGGPAAGVMRDAFSAALVAQLPRLRRYARALTGSASAADDLVQDCIERALRRADTLQSPERMASWLRSILHNIFIDQIRRRPARVTTVDVTEVDADVSLSVSPDSGAASLDIVRAVNRLTHEHRQILLLAGLEGLSYSEIAAELGLPLGTVMSRLARAREKFRLMLDPDLPEVQGARNG